MEDQKINEHNQELAIILHIDEGINLNLQNEPLICVASLGGNVLESDVVIPGHSIVFDTNLVWETDKKTVKRMKTENYPVKVEVYAIKSDENQYDRQLIGQLLFPVRNIPLLPPAKAMTMKSRWCRLTGLAPDWKNLKPELFLSIMIINKEFYQKTKKAFMMPSQSDEYMSFDDQPMDMLTSQQGIFIRLLKNEGLLQVGNIDTDCDVFLAKILIMSVRNIENILEPSDTLINVDAFSLRYIFPENEIPFNCEMIKISEGVYSVQEIIAINVRTSLDVLQTYFKKVFYIPIQICYGETVIGNSKLSLDNLLTIGNLNDFILSCHDNQNTFETESACPIISTQTLDTVLEKPLIEFRFMLTYVSTHKLAVCEINKNRKKEIDVGVAGDHMDEPQLPQINSPPATPLKLEHIGDDKGIVISPKLGITHATMSETAEDKFKIMKPEGDIPVSVADKTDIQSILNTKEKDLDEVPRTFSYNLVLQSVKFTNRVENGIWQISFYHPRADAPFTIVNVELQNVEDESVDFNDLELQLYFSSTPNEILDIITSDNCLFNICGPRGTRGKAELDSQSLMIGNKERKSGIILLENQNGEKMAMANIFAYLDDLGINYNSKIKMSIPLEINAPTGKAYVDEGFAYRFVEELEKWKKSQEENYLVELKRKEIQHLAKLTAEWKRKKSKMEKDLIEKVEKCNALQTTLEEAQKTLKERDSEQIQQERLLFQAKTELEQRYNNQLLQIKEKARRMEDDMERKLHHEQLKYKELEISKQAVDKENDQLSLRVVELEKQVTELKDAFPKKQIVSLFQDVRLLNERYENAQKSKMFYKEQWAKMIREVHMLKAGAVNKYKGDILERKYLGIDSWLENEKFELDSDMSEIEFIRQSFDCD